jgi:hypothetical protein
MNDAPKKFNFEDLQPHVDMLCDALENKGASPSGIPHNKEVADNAERYREVLTNIRSKRITFEDLLYELHLLKHQTLEATIGNQEYRVSKIVHALDFFIMKEYNKIRNDK